MYIIRTVCISLATPANIADYRHAVVKYNKSWTTVPVACNHHTVTSPFLSKRGLRME